MVLRCLIPQLDHCWPKVLAGPRLALYGRGQRMIGEKRASIGLAREAFPIPKWRVPHPRRRTFTNEANLSPPVDNTVRRPNALSNDTLLASTLNRFDTIANGTPVACHYTTTSDAQPAGPTTPPVTAIPLHPPIIKRPNKTTRRSDLRQDMDAMLAFGMDKNDKRLQRPIKQKKKKSKKDEKPIPPILSFEEARDQLERRFAEIEKEHLGPKRGVATVKFLVGKKGEKIHKTVTTKMANTILNDWVYTRHAMNHGYRHLTEMTKKALSASLIRPGTTVKYDERDARLSLKELFRYGKSDMLEKYHALDRRRDLTVQEIDTNYTNNMARRTTLTDLGYSPDQIAREDGLLLQRALRRGLHPGPNSGTLPEPPVEETSSIIEHRIRNLADRAQMQAAGYTMEEIVKEETARHRHNLQRDARLQVVHARYKTRQTPMATSPLEKSTPMDPQNTDTTPDNA